jgi:ubiquinone/menaquinone biosynthesis C-methylase UbiE
MIDVFNQIASSWYNFRHRSIFRAELENLAKRWKQGRVLNVGCAHGPDFVPLNNGGAELEMHGADFSDEMLRLARKYADKFDFDVSLVEADARYLPYADGTFDWAVAAAVYHHMMGKEDRLKALTELHRVLKDGGEAFITVWNRWQPRFWFKRRLQHVPWRTKEKTIYRHYYLFSYYELEKLVRQAGFQILQSGPENNYRFPVKSFSHNICLLLVKPYNNAITL